MVFRLCLCVILLCACGYATKSTDYCRVLVNYDTFKTSVDNFLASMGKTCGTSDVRSESKETCLDAVDNRINDLEKEVVKLLRDNENKDIRLSYLETAIANLTSTLSVDCGSPTPIEGTYVVYDSTGLLGIANYRCRQGFLKISPRDNVMSVCQKDRSWTKVNLKCADISGCWAVSNARVLYTGTQSTTRSGKTCQRWDAQKPHSHDNNKDAKFAVPGFDTPQTVAGSANYCRDPTRAGFVWCYTTNPDSRWEKCDVPICPN